ncbi:MAG: PIN domain-containing protein [Ardenticatenales bacterium]|nr:PIN domain-containing protein [Ardenticatenales bacterium]
MIDVLLDTTVILHIYRQYQPALTWLNNPQRYGVTSVTWLEVMEGVSSKSSQVRCKTLLSQCELLFLTAADQQWAMQQLEQFQFSHHIGMADCLIAAVAYRLQLPLYTHNLKDMTPLIGTLAVKPYA